MIKTASRQSFLETALNYLPEQSICAEIGVLRGEFSQDILRILKPDKLTLIDPWSIGQATYGKDLEFLHTAYSTEMDYMYVKEQFHNEVQSGQIELNRNFSYDAVKNFPDKYFDFIYIDACHLYQCVKGDLNDYLPKLKDTGLMCGHDYHTFDNFGVVQAVDEFITENNFELLIMDDGHDWALRKKQTK